MDFLCKLCKLFLLLLSIQNLQHLLCALALIFLFYYKKYVMIWSCLLTLITSLNWVIFIIHESIRLRHEQPSDDKSKNNISRGNRSGSTYAEEFRYLREKGQSCRYSTIALWYLGTVLEHRNLRSWVRE